MQQPEVTEMGGVGAMGWFYCFGKCMDSKLCEKSVSPKKREVKRLKK